MIISNHSAIALREVRAKTSLTGCSPNLLHDAPARLSAKKVYTICLAAQDGGSFDLSPDAKEVTLSVVLAR
jgi:hypothetical protein